MVDVNIEKVLLKNQTPKGESLSVCFVPQKGMNFISYKKGQIEALDQSTQAIFEDRFSGLGALIGPHFHHRKPNLIKSVKNEALFPYIGRLKARGIHEPFSHGIGRYAPWTIVFVNQSELKATLSGEDVWNGESLKDLEGQNFKMSYHARLTPEGLAIELSVKSEQASVVGLHTYYALSGGEGQITTHVAAETNDQGILKPIQGSPWNYSKPILNYDLKNEIDNGFYPAPDSCHGSVLMKTRTHALKVEYWSPTSENSLQIWHPKQASFVCIEPLSAKDPRNPRLSESSLKILISLL